MPETAARALTCPECGAAMVLKPSRFKPFFGCSRWPETGCPGSHGAHPDGSPMGVPANGATKRARVRAHEAFDRMWKSGHMTRKEAYRWMQLALGMTRDEAHIGKYSEAECEQLIALVEASTRRMA
jgi:ssDNA-binding Zn-finger/Zn-ribbon topoisomerase 1